MFWENRMKIQHLAGMVGGLGLLVGFINPAMATPTVRLRTDPVLDRVVPFQDAVKLTLEVVQEDGQPLENVRLQIQLDTPATTPWLTTDFPIVEGTTLLNLETIVPQGQFQFEQTLPIRGAYSIQVAVSPQVPGAFAPFTETLTFSVAENPEKYKNLAILLLILLSVGFTGGWVIGERQPLAPGEVAPQRVRLLLSGAIGVAILALVLINISAELAGAHNDHSDHKTDHKTNTDLSAAPSRYASQTIKAELVGGNAIVGQLLPLSVQLSDPATQLPVTDAVLQIYTIAVEDSELVSSFTASPDQQGNFSWQQQFFDGAPHQILVEVLPQANLGQPFQPFEVTEIIEVQAVEPPLLVRLISLTYLMGVLTIGFGSGFWLRQRGQASQG